jgi:hypothetical protein
LSTTIAAPAALGTRTIEVADGMHGAIVQAVKG